MKWILLAQTPNYPLEFMTRGVFDTVIIVVIIIGVALALARLYRDFTRPLPENEDTQPNKPTEPETYEESS